MSKSPHPTQIFTPGAPVNRKDFFAGRLRQIERVVETIPSPGRHPIIFGQRGVGKTSLANILSELLPDVWAIKVNCDGADTFQSIWDRVLQKASVGFKKAAFGLRQEEVTEYASLRSFIPHDKDIGPSDVANVFDVLHTHAVFVLDEFDRVSNEETKSQMADLIKNVSDNDINVTIVLVGVSKSITGLVGEHPSVQRNLVQIELPPMSNEEIIAIITNGCNALDLSLTQEVLDEISYLSHGFPHYAHLLGLSVAKAAHSRETDSIDIELFHSLACELAVEDAIETYRSAFTKATRTIKPSRYPKLLCACAHAVHDEHGVFRATDVVDAMLTVFSETLTLQAVVPALGKFCDKERGPVLEKVPVADFSHYRFVDPMLRPFLMIKTKGLLKAE